ncbi:MAG: YafY family transcriptional regulator [Actinobacteria bacterium]|nr:YafY family transcriptional regulator [Actinomycetota bacterium]MDI6830457.1 YafY family protein [Actinomycetota bacterium]
MNKAERLIDLIAMLLQARKPVTLEQIRSSIPGYGQASMSAFKRMFERDKSELREMGIPIQVVPVDALGEEFGYRIPKEQYYLPELDFSPEEKVALLLVNRLSSGELIPFSREAAAALRKLSPDLGEGSRLGGPAAPRLRFAPIREREEVLNMLWRAAVECRTVRFAYRSPGKGKGRAKERELDPYGLYLERGSWYVVGFCHLRGEVRSFRVSRIESEVEFAHREGKGPDFVRPPDFRLEEHARILPWEFEEGAPREARVRFSPRMAWQVEKDLGDVYRFEAAPDGGGVLEVTVRNEDAFLNWVLSYAEDAEVLSPPDLREKTVRRLERLLKSLGDV